MRAPRVLNKAQSMRLQLLLSTDRERALELIAEHLRASARTYAETGKRRKRIAKRYVFVCEQCHVTFTKEKKRAYKYCSTTCRNRGTARKFDQKLLRDMALAGAVIRRMAEALDVNVCTVGRKLRQMDLYVPWTQQRYRKVQA